MPEQFQISPLLEVLQRIARPPFRSGNAFLDSRKSNIVIPDGEAEADEIFGLGKMPPPEGRILSENLGMLCQGEWQPRFLVLDSEFASISLVGSDDILDKVPLVPFSVHNSIECFVYERYLHKLTLLKFPA
jgi:hypothetical protein